MSYEARSIVDADDGSDEDGYAGRRRGREDPAGLDTFLMVPRCRK